MLKKKLQIIYLITLKLSFGITFSIFLFGEGKSILSTKTNKTKRAKIKKINFISSFPKPVKGPDLVFLPNCIYP